MGMRWILTSINCLPNRMEQLSLLFGVFVKGYDDGVDGAYSLSPFVASSLQSLLVAVFTLLSGNDFYFTLACFFFACLNPGIDQPFWKSTIPLTGFLLWMSFTPEVSLARTLATTLGIAVFLLGTFIEDFFFPEEYSWKKAYSRIFMLAGALLASMVHPWIGEFLPRFSYVPIQKTIYILLGYLSVSVVSQFYQLVGAEAEAEAGADFFGKVGRFLREEEAMEVDADARIGSAGTPVSRNQERLSD